MVAAEKPAPPAGPAVDARGLPADDPTANVLALVDAAVKRLDDLRSAEKLRLDQLREAEARHTHDVLQLRDSQIAERQHFNEKLREAETNRIDAIRAVDITAVSRAAEVQAAQAIALANQVAVSAETLRNQVSASASATATALASALQPIQKDIAELRKTQYEQAGQKAQQTENKGTNQWAIGLAISFIFLALAIVGFAISLAAGQGK